MKGKYAAVEWIKELDDGRVEWRMATTSEPGGMIPGFLASGAIPGAIANVSLSEILLSQLSRYLCPRGEMVTKGMARLPFNHSRMSNTISTGCRRTGRIPPLVPLRQSSSRHPEEAISSLRARRFKIRKTS